MIDVKTASKRASEYLLSFYPNATGLQLEEVELIGEKEFWLITISYINEEPRSGVFIQFPPKSYKIIKLDALNGEFVSMKIRDFK
jgi:hypothetical protein